MRCRADSTVPTSTAITVDGELVGTTPLGGPLYLDAGRRRVSFTKPGYRGVVRVETVAGESSLAWMITPERLRISVLGP